jgi:hypothetical protein
MDPTDSGKSGSDEESADTRRLMIELKQVQPLLKGRRTFFDLAGELRNEIYRLALAKDYQCLPLNPYYLNKPDTHIALLQASSVVYYEARSYLIENQTAYIPVISDMDWTYGEPAAEYGLTRATKDTSVCALTDLMSVHFHLQIDLLRKEEYESNTVWRHSLQQSSCTCRAPGRST